MEHGLHMCAHLLVGSENRPRTKRSYFCHSCHVTSERNWKMNLMDMCPRKVMSTMFDGPSLPSMMVYTSSGWPPVVSLNCVCEQNYFTIYNVIRLRQHVNNLLRWISSLTDWHRIFELKAIDRPRVDQILNNCQVQGHCSFWREIHWLDMRFHRKMSWQTSFAKVNVSTVWMLPQLSMISRNGVNWCVIQEFASSLIGWGVFEAGTRIM